MKTQVQKLPLEKDSSFVARIYETPEFETPYHHHTEYELMVIVKGEGTAFVGDHIGEYKTGDVYLHGKDLPHWFKKKDEQDTGASMVVQFREDFLGPGFFDVPEMTFIKSILEKASRGVLCKGKVKAYIEEELPKLEFMDGYSKTIALLNMLHTISVSGEYELVSSRIDYRYSDKDRYLINLVFEYTLKHFKRKIELAELASLTNKSESAFSHYFKKTTKVGYVYFLTQIRIAHACKLLKKTNLSVTEICYTSGFHNWANFSKHFKTHCGMPPTAYRKSFVEK